jgi:RHS repeat-associated protein
MPGPIHSFANYCVAVRDCGGCARKQVVVPTSCSVGLPRGSGRPCIASRMIPTRPASAARPRKKKVPFESAALIQPSVIGPSYYRARYYDTQIGRFTMEDPLRFGAGSTNFYGYVYQNPTNYTDPNGRIPIYGNWCGPDWTGGKVEPFNPAHFKDYRKPIDALDGACMHHDICYFNCRSTQPCNKGARRRCMSDCDKLLTAENPLGGFKAYFIWWFIAADSLYPVEVGSNESCGCKSERPK